MLKIINLKQSVLPKINSSNTLTTFLNPVSYLKARKHLEYYEQFDCLLADGWLFVAALRVVGITTQRHSFDMTSLAPIVFQNAIAEKKSVYFLGAKPTEIADFIEVIKNHFPNLNILGYRDGYFRSIEERNFTLQYLQDLAPDVVIAGLGAPLQEQFLIDLQKTGWNGCGYTCGGFIHQTSEKLNYYPNWVNKLHLRMPYRFFKEPHFRKRIPDYFKFLILFTYDYINYRKKGKYLNM